MTKLTAAELRKTEDRQLRETQHSLRRKLLESRLEFFLAASTATGQRRNMRKSLARVLTIVNERKLQTAAKGGTK